MALTHSPPGLPTIKIRSSMADYTVVVHASTDLAAWEPSGDFLVVDAFFQNRLQVPPGVPVVYVEATEQAKSYHAVLTIFLALKEAGLSRSSTLIAIGGGVIQDIATFVASLYMRGIVWSYVPTTFLGMTDSCLGGKSSINAGPYKNLIGNFHPPRNIEILPGFTRSLPLVEIRGGAAEAAKIAWCRGSAAFEAHRRLAEPLLSGTWEDSDLAALVHATLTIKQWFIERDEFDRAERRLLNFGHTWGHALESATGFAVPHGLAVAIGMLAAIEFCGRSVEQEPLRRHSLTLLDGVVSFAQIDCFDETVFRQAFRGDKKHSPGNLHVIVPQITSNTDDLGVVERRLPDDPQSLDAVVKAMIRALQDVATLASHL